MKLANVIQRTMLEDCRGWQASQMVAPPNGCHSGLCKMQWHFQLTCTRQNTRDQL